MEKCCVFFGVQTEFLNIFLGKLPLQRIKPCSPETEVNFAKWKLNKTFRAFPSDSSLGLTAQEQ
jgi:hypothetical protein